jgi:hypothetical protein
MKKDMLIEELKQRIEALRAEGRVAARQAYEPYRLSIRETERVLESLLSLEDEQ